MTLHQIRALVAFSDIAAGTVGGWIEAENNLSHEGNAWVYGDAQVSGNAWVYSNARVSGNAQVYDNAQVYGDAQVSGNAWVYSNAQVYGDAQVSGDALVYGDAQVSGDARVSPIFLSGLRYAVTITDQHIRIGCEFHTIDEWRGFDDRRILEMDGRDSARFWKAHRDQILGLCDATGRPFPQETV